MDCRSPERRRNSLPRSAAIHERLVGAFPEQSDYRLDLAKHHNNLGNLLQTVGRQAGAQSEFRRALAVAETLIAANGADPRYRFVLAFAQNGLGAALGAENRLAEAETALVQAVAAVAAARRRVSQRARALARSGSVESNARLFV